MKVVDATPDLVPALLERMGPERTAALAARAGGDPVQAIGDNIARSTSTWAGLDDAGVVVMGGVLPDGYVWQFLTDVRRCKREFIRMHRAKQEDALRRHPRLVTVIEAEYRAAMRSAARLGWTIGEPRDVNGVLACICERFRA